MAMDRDAIPWGEIENAYERTDEPVRQICARYGITTRMLYAKMEEEGWERRNDGGEEGRPSAGMKQIAEVKRLVRKRLTFLKQAEKKGSMPADAVSQLAALVRLLERLDGLEEKRLALERMRRKPQLVNDARRLELARRLESLRRQCENEAAERRELDPKAAAPAG